MKFYGILKVLFVVFGLSVFSFNLDCAQSPILKPTLDADFGEGDLPDIWSDADSGSGDSDSDSNNIDSKSDDADEDEHDHEDSLDTSFEEKATKSSSDDEDYNKFVAGFGAILNPYLDFDEAGVCENQIVIVINGPTGSGKSRLVKAFINKIDEAESWEIVATDDIECLSGDEDEATIKAIQKRLICRKNVICDTVLVDNKSIELFKTAFEGKVKFVLCFLCNSLGRLIENFKTRNLSFDANERRNLGQVLEGFLDFYSPSEPQDNCIGSISLQDTDLLHEAISNCENIEMANGLANRALFKLGCSFKLINNSYNLVIDNESEDVSPEDKLISYVGQL